MSKRRGNFLLLGALIGFIAGLFFAPKKGSELRRDAKNKIDEIKENPKDVLQGTFDDVKEKINEFIVPGTSICSANLHIARTVCRRAERRILTLSREDRINPILLKYVNRLSDLLYILARYSEEEIIPVKF